MRLAAAGHGTDLSVVKLLLILSKFLWQVVACEDNIPNDLLMMKQEWTAGSPYLQRLPTHSLWHKPRCLSQLPPSGIDGPGCLRGQPCL